MNCAEKHLLLFLLSAALLIPGCKQKDGGHQGGESAPEAVMQKSGEKIMVKTPSGLQYEELVPGSGASPSPGRKVTVHYTGWLANGAKFDSSLDRNEPFSFIIGAGQVIKGWEEGVMSMKIGGKRKLVIPPGLGYGDAGAGGLIPGGATLVFEVILLDIR